MASSYTTLLGLVLPVQGELSGVWGDTVNNELTSLLDTAIAGTTTLNTDADVTLSTTTGAANQARQQIILWTANGTTTRNITAPAQSKSYIVINASAGTQSIVLRGVGPTTGVTVLKGEQAVVAWNGSDFVKVSTFGGSPTFTNVTVSGTTTLSALTASTALALNASKEVVSVTNTGTGNNVLSASPTFTGTIGAAAATLSGNLTLSGGTANGVAYLDGSKVLTTGSALTFDGTNLKNTTSAGGVKLEIVSTSGSPEFSLTSADTGSSQINFGGTTAPKKGKFVYSDNSDLFYWVLNTNSEQMRLTSTGLGIGTSSPISYAKLTLEKSGGDSAIALVKTGGAQTGYIAADGINAWIGSSFGSTGKKFFVSLTAPDNAATLDSSGNLGLGVTPSAWSRKAFEIACDGSAGYIAGNNGTIVIGNNVRYNSGDFYINTNYATYYAQNPALGTHTWAVAPSGTAGNAISFTQAMTLDASGNLGVGTASPSVASGLGIVVNGGAGQPRIALKNSNTGDAAGDGFQLAVDTSSNAYIDQRENAALIFNTNNNERARITSGGDLLVGRTDLPQIWSAASTRVAAKGNASNFAAEFIAESNNGIRKVSFFASGTTDVAGVWLPTGSIDMVFGTNNNERARITSGGDLLVGTTATVGRLTVDSGSVGIYGAFNSSNANGGYLEFRSSGTVYGDIGTAAQVVSGSASDFGINARGSRNLIFGTNNNERARITSGGDLLVGQTATGYQNSLSVAVQGPSGYVLCNHVNGTGSGAVYAGFGYNGSGIGSITQDGTTGVLYNLTSDRRLKDNIVPAPSASDDIDAIQIVSYEWKSAPDEPVKYGVIAQDLHSVAPRAVKKGDDGEDIVETWGVDYSKLVPMLIKEIQSLRARVAALETN